MKKIALVLFAGISLGSAKAQIQFGVKAGANIATLTGDNATGVNSLVGIHFGGLVNIPLVSSLSLQPELLYSGQGAKATTSGVDFSQHNNYINVPVLLKYTSSVGLYGETGPQLGFLITSKAKSGGNSSDTKSGYKSTDFSWAFGVGYLISSANIGIDARYNLGLSNLVAANGNGTLKNGVFQFGVFYLFGDSGKK